MERRLLNRKKVDSSRIGGIWVSDLYMRARRKKVPLTLGWQRQCEKWLGPSVREYNVELGALHRRCGDREQGENLYL